MRRGVQERIELVKASVDVLMLASQFSELAIRGRSGSGPCPKCGGNDRFFITTQNRVACRKCHPALMDVIAFIQWVNGVCFLEALTWLEGAAWNVPPSVRPLSQRVSQVGRSSTRDFGSLSS